MPKEQAPRSAARILIIKPSSLGDIVHALPVLAALRRAQPDAHIAWLAGATFAPLLEDHPLLDEIIPFDRSRFGKMLSKPRILIEFLRFIRRIRARRFDLVIDLQGLIRSGIIAHATGAERRVGFASARELAWLFYTQRIRCPRGARHAVDRNLCIAAALGLDVETPQFPLRPGPEESARAGALLNAAARRPVDGFIAVIPGARWKTKRWLPERMAGLIDRIHGDGLPPCVLLGAPADRDFTGEIVSACRTEVIDLVGRTTLRGLVALLGRAACVVAHDSGPLHIAAALSTPIVAVFGPTDPAKTGPYAAKARVISARIYCAPCQRRCCWHHSCMHLLDTPAVLDAVRESLADVLGPAVAEAAD